jgi:hypothetical protein
MGLKLLYSACIKFHQQTNIYYKQNLGLFLKQNKKFWEELIAYFPLTRHGPHRKRRVQQFFYRFMSVRCRGNVFTELLPSNDMRIDIQTHGLMGGIYEVRR